MVTLTSTHKNDKPVTFQGVVMPFIQEHSHGRSYYRMHITDNNGDRFSAYAWENNYQGLYIEYPTPVIVTGIYKKNRGVIRFQVLSLTHNETETFNCNPDACSELARLMEFESLTEQQNQDLIKLQQLIDLIQQPHLKSFLQNLFSDKELMKAFTELPASARHHHHQRGGLMNHSIECAIFVFNATQGNLMSRDERELAVVASLLHDVGKIKTMTTENKHSKLGHHIQHEQLTLTVLSGYLNTLENHWPNGAALMMHLLTWDKNKQGFPGNPMALLIKTADQFSTAMDIRKQAFKDKPESYYYAHYATSSGKQYFNRLTVLNNG